MDYKIIDDFLSEEELRYLQNLIVYNSEFPLFFNNSVSFKGEPDSDWRWYATHILYNKDIPNSEYFKGVYDIFIPKFSQVVGFKSLIRIKANMYPHTDTLKENEQHVDLSFPHHAAVFSLNTCDGFTRMNDGNKVDSVENRIVFFDASLPHNSTTTTNKARYNINFNWL
jgi:hypothetical protein